MSKKTSLPAVNLLPHPESSLGEKFLEFSLTFGRYIIIGTEIIVLLAFLSRFKLDRDLIDLNDKVKEQQQRLTLLKPVENNLLSLQERLNKIKTAEASQGKGILALSQLSAITPTGITYKTVSAVGDKITITGLATQVEQTSAFVANMKASPLFKKETVTLESIERGKDSTQNITFTLSAVVE